MRVMFTSCLVLIALGTVSAQEKPPAGKPPASKPAAAKPAADKPSANKKAFHRARLAATAETWEAAAEILEKIDVNKLDDVDVVEYVTFSRLCVKTADALGVKRNSDPDSPLDVVTKIEWESLITTLAETAVTSPIKFVGLLRDARKVQKRLKMYGELDTKLVKKYGEK